MRIISQLLAGALIGALALAAAGCSGGGGTSATMSVAPPPPASPTPGSSDGQFVVAYDYNNDEQLDLLTLDSTVSPMKIVAVFEGTAGGGMTDQTTARAGQPIDPKISDALGTYLSSATEIASGTEIELTDSAGVTVNLTVYE